MADIFAAGTDEVCYVSVQDVRDTLKGVFLSSAIPLIQDADIELLIIEAQNQVNAYLNEINADIPCTGIVKEQSTTNGKCNISLDEICYCEVSSSIFVDSCQDVPMEIKRATMQLVDTVYTNNESSSSISTGAATLMPGDVLRERTACGVEIEYYAGDSSNNQDMINPCILVDCKTQRLLSCYEKKSASFSLCKTPCCNTKKCNGYY